jgi:hypothetical protein
VGQVTPTGFSERCKRAGYHKQATPYGVWRFGRLWGRGHSARTREK